MTSHTLGATINSVHHGQPITSPQQQVVNRTHYATRCKLTIPIKQMTCHKIQIWKYNEHTATLKEHINSHLQKQKIMCLTSSVLMLMNGLNDRTGYMEDCPARSVSFGYLQDYANQ